MLSSHAPIAFPCLALPDLRSSDLVAKTEGHKAQKKVKTTTGVNRLAMMQTQVNTLTQSAAQEGPHPADVQAMRQMQDMFESALEKVWQMEANLNDSKEQQHALQGADWSAAKPDHEQVRQACPRALGLKHHSDGQGYRATVFCVGWCVFLKTTQSFTLAVCIRQPLRWVIARRSFEKEGRGATPSGLQQKW